MKRCGIYLITNTANGKIYVGSSVDLDKRWYMHQNRLAAGSHRNSHLQRAWEKYGAAAFTFSVLELTERECLIEREQFWIDKLCTSDEVSYNICRVAANTRLGVKVSEETRQRMSESTKGQRHSEETRAKMSAAKTGRKMPPRSQEHRDKIGAARRGRKASEETRAKMRAARARRTPPSAETRAKMAESMRKTLAAKKANNEITIKAKEK